MKLKNLLFTTEYPPFNGGIANLLYNLVTKTTEFHWTVVTSKHDKSIEFDIKENYDIIRLSFYPIRSCYIRLLCKIKNVFGFSNSPSEIINTQISKIIKPLLKSYDIWHFDQLRTGWFGMKYKPIYRKKYVLYLHGMELLNILRSSNKNKKINKKIIQNADIVFVNSNYTKSLVSKLCNNKANTHLMKLPVDLEEFSPNNKKTLAKSSLGLKNDLIILTVGRMVERKGHDILIECVNEIRNSIPNIRLIIIGNGKEENKLRSMVKQYALTNYVDILTNVPDNKLPLYYTACDIFAMPCKKTIDSVEGFGIVFLEAAASGKPVIVGDSGGAREALVDNKTGFLVDPNSSEDIIKKIVTLLQDDDLRKKMGKNGRKFVEQNHSIDCYKKSILRHLNKL